VLANRSAWCSALTRTPPPGPSFSAMAHRSSIEDIADLEIVPELVEHRLPVDVVDLVFKVDLDVASSNAGRLRLSATIGQKSADR